MIRNAALIQIALLGICVAAQALQPGFSEEVLKQLPKEQQAAMATAHAFLTAVFKHDLAMSLQHASVPFFWDKKQVLATQDELKQQLKRLLDEEIDDGIEVTAEEIYPIGAFIAQELPESARKFIDEHLGKGAVLYVAFIDDEQVRIFLRQHKDKWKVAGFED